MWTLTARYHIPIFLSSSSQHIELLDNRIRTISLENSAVFILHRASTIDLEGNRMRSLSSAVLNTLNTSLPHFQLLLNSYNDPFCPGMSTCNCCDMRDFGLWLKDHMESLYSFSAQCGATKYWIHDLPALASQLQEPCVENVILPHSSCDFHGFILRCHNTNSVAVFSELDFYETPSTVREISLKIVEYVSGDAGMDFPSIPKREKLTAIDIQGIRTLLSALQVFPFDRLLTENKHNILRLRLSSVKLMRLTVANFRGFNQLEHLEIDNCLIQDIHPDLFENLAVTHGTFEPGWTSGIRFVRIANNNISHLNWEFLRPVSQSIEVRLCHANVEQLRESWSMSFQIMSHHIMNFTKRGLIFNRFCHWNQIASWPWI